MYQGREQFTLFIQILNVRIENSIEQNMNRKGCHSHFNTSKFVMPPDLAPVV